MKHKLHFIFLLKESVVVFVVLQASYSPLSNRITRFNLHPIRFKVRDGNELHAIYSKKSFALSALLRWLAKSKVEKAELTIWCAFCLFIGFLVFLYFDLLSDYIAKKFVLDVRIKHIAS